MDNVGDWLYIVFLIIAGLSSILSSRKKKKRPTEILGQPGKDIVVQENNIPQKGFWEILEEMQEQKPRSVQQPVKPNKKTVKQAKMPEPSPFLNTESKLNKPAFTEDNSLVMPSEEETAFSNFEIHDVAELRKAVIYAEILNRKY